MAASANPMDATLIPIHNIYLGTFCVIACGQALRHMSSAAHRKAYRKQKTTGVTSPFESRSPEGLWNKMGHRHVHEAPDLCLCRLRENTASKKICFARYVQRRREVRSRTPIVKARLGSDAPEAILIMRTQAF